VYFGVGPEPDASTTGSDEVTGQDEEPDARPPHQRTPVTMSVAIGLLLVLGLLTGVLPRAGSTLAEAAAQFTDQHGYVAAALRGVVGKPGEIPESEWTVSGVVIGLTAATLAVAVALTGLYAPRLPEAVRRPSRTLEPAVRALHKLHSGHLGDYAAWLVLGTAAITALLVL
jgi:multicomponent Na+:H+ antiporter subunit D